MSRFFAVFLLLLSAVPACQAAPVESKNGEEGLQRVKNLSDSEIVEPKPLPPSVQLPSQQFRKPLSPPQSPPSSPSPQYSGKHADLLLKASAESRKLHPSLSLAPSEQYTRPSSLSPSPVIQSPQSPYSRKHPADSPIESSVRPTVSLPPSVSLPPRQYKAPPSPSSLTQPPQSPDSDKHPNSPAEASVRPNVSLPPSVSLPSRRVENPSTIVQCPSDAVPCPPECPPECLPQPPVSKPEPPKKQTGWRNGLMNLMNVCLKAIVGSFTDLVVVTGERPPKKPRKTQLFFSFGKKKDERVSKQPTDGDDSDQGEMTSVGCVWYRDLRSRPPRRPAPMCVTGPGGRQCNFCCVGENLFNCSNCLTINCNPQINCCSCTINVTVVNNITVENNLNVGDNISMENKLTNVGDKITMENKLTIANNT